MRRIISIGGVYQRENKLINNYIVSTSKVETPSLLFLPTASLDDDQYIKDIIKEFGDCLKCKVEFIKLVNGNVNICEVRRKIELADIIYVGGGNTLDMLAIWDKYNIIRLLKSAYQKGTLMCGISAGGMCWFNRGISRYIDVDVYNFKIIKCLSIIDFHICVHYEVEERKMLFREYIKTDVEIGIGIESGCAIDIIDERHIKVVCENSEVKAELFYIDRFGKQTKKVLTNRDEIDILSLF